MSMYVCACLAPLLKTVTAVIQCSCAWDAHMGGFSIVGPTHPGSQNG